jgi:hypothetical protein
MNSQDRLSKYLKAEKEKKKKQGNKTYEEPVKTVKKVSEWFKTDNLPKETKFK